MTSIILPKLIVIQSNYYQDQGNAYYKEDGTVVIGEQDVMSMAVKIEAERATSNNKYVNLRFCNSNRYWAKSTKNAMNLAAESKQPEEDTSKESCTLFQAFKASSDDENGGIFYLKHVQSGLRVWVDAPWTKRFFLMNNDRLNVQTHLRFVNWESLVKLPKHVAFKGYNGAYLKGIWAGDINSPFLQLAADDPNDPICGFKITTMTDGHVRIYSDYFNRFWRLDQGWIWAEEEETGSRPYDANTLFWPVKQDENTVAFRCAGNDCFVQGYDKDGFVSCLSAVLPNITHEARLRVEELVSRRKVYNVRYRMEDARIFDETPYLAGIDTVYNYGDMEAATGVEVSYEDSKSSTFNRSVSLKAGVETEIDAGVPFIAEAKVKINAEISGTLEWGETQTDTVTVKATGSVPVPPRHKAVVHYVGTKGHCDVPFSYTQQDTSSTDGRIIETEQIDGVYTGVNCYNFSFVVERAVPL